MESFYLRVCTTLSYKSINIYHEQTFILEPFTGPFSPPVRFQPITLKSKPAFWWSGMKNPELQLMVYGEGIGNAAVSVNYPGVSLSSTVKLESNNYLLVYLKLDKDVKPGKFNLTFTEGKRTRKGI